MRQQEAFWWEGTAFGEQLKASVMQLHQHSGSYFLFSDWTMV